MSFDINTIINSAIMQAVEAHVAGINQIYAQRLGEMADKIAALEEENMRARMNHDKLVERVSEARIKLDAVDAVITAQAQPKVELDGDRVKEIAKSTVHELWSDVYETEVQDIAERAIQDHDFDDAISQALHEYDMTDAVEAVLEDYDLSNRIEEGIDEYDFGDKLEGAFKERMNELLNNATISISV